MLRKSAVSRKESKFTDTESGPGSGCLTYGKEESMPEAKAVDKEKLGNKVGHSPRQTCRDHMEACMPC